jgi:hypothetical protein
VKILLLTFIIFQIWHAFSHAQHIDADVQSNIVHVILYLVYAALIFSISSLSTQRCNSSVWLILLFFVFIDLFIWYNVRGFWMVVSGLQLLTVVMICFYGMLPDFVKTAIPWLVAGVGILILMIYNEEKNCDKMLKWASLPYHAIVEIIGLGLFVALAYLFTSWDQKFILFTKSRV